MKRGLVGLALLAALIVGCSDDGASPDASATVEATAATEPDGPGVVTVSAASSLTDAFTELAEAFKAAHPGTEVRLNFAASSALATQIVEGAPVDVFASANEAQMKVVTDAGEAGGPAVFATNRIVIATPGDDTRVTSLADLALPGLRLVLGGAEVPVGGYARAAFKGAEASGTLPAGFEAAVLANLASEEANVRAVLAKVELGEADAGIVYATDARGIAGVRTVEIPAEFAAPAVYPIIVLREAEEPVSAQAFVDFVLSDAGQAILAGYGFAPPGG